MNVRRLRAVTKRILAEPTHFSMDTWAKEEQNAKAESCGTTCCIAGHALIAAGAKLTFLLHVDPDTLAVPNFVPTPRLTKFTGLTTDIGVSNGDVANVAQALLGLTWHEAERLFYTWGWPVRFENAYKAAKTAKGRARVAARRIEHFVNTHGDQ